MKNQINHICIEFVGLDVNLHNSLCWVKKRSKSWFHCFRMYIFFSIDHNFVPHLMGCRLVSIGMFKFFWYWRIDGLIMEISSEHSKWIGLWLNWQRFFLRSSGIYYKWWLVVYLLVLKNAYNSIRSQLSDSLFRLSTFIKFLDAIESNSGRTSLKR